MIGDDYARLAAPLDDPCQFPCDPPPGDRQVGNGAQTFARDVVDDVTDIGSLIAAMVPDYRVSDTVASVSCAFVDIARKALADLVSAYAPACVMLVRPPLSIHFEQLRQSTKVPLVEGVS